MNEEGEDEEEDDVVTLPSATHSATPWLSKRVETSRITLEYAGLPPQSVIRFLRIAV